METKQFGTVLVFKQGTPREEIEKALKQIEDLLEHKPCLHEFDPKWGGPVWYIP